MSWIAFALTAWILFGLELGLKDALQLGASGVAPSFVMVLLVIVSLHAPRLTALWAALIIGVGLDLTAPLVSASGLETITLVGPKALGCLVSAYAILTMRTLVMRRNIFTIALLSLIAVSLLEIVAVFAYVSRSWFDSRLEITAGATLVAGLGAAVYTAILALPLGAALQSAMPIFGFQQSVSRPRIRRV
ncbi:MAG: hypothetical protein EA376_11580 [Phycisphaeraceae bacterium]|nr:MAG: hypothetical protein EA376_11580 [Phycisphaeraceae bacterium]